MLENIKLHTVLKLGLLYGAEPQNKGDMLAGNAPLFVLEGGDDLVGLLRHPWSYVFQTLCLEDVARSLTSGDLHGHHFTMPLSVGAREIISSYHWLGIIFREPRRNCLYSLYGVISLDQPSWISGEFDIRDLQATKERSASIVSVEVDDPSDGPSVTILPNSAIRN